MKTSSFLTILTISILYLSKKYHYFIIDCANSSISRAFNFANGRGIFNNSSTTLSPHFTTKHPLRGFSLLQTTVYPFFVSRSDSFTARVLNAFHDLQYSIFTFFPLATLLLLLLDASVVVAVSLIFLFGPIFQRFDSLLKSNLLRACMNDSAIEEKGVK